MVQISKSDKEEVLKLIHSGHIAQTLDQFWESDDPHWLPKE